MGSKHRKSKKGGAYEREFSKFLSLWWSGGEDDNLFWRSQASGGRSTSRAKRGSRTQGNEGDIASTHPSSRPFTDFITLELKRGYSDSTIMNTFDRPSAGLVAQDYDQWIAQADAAHKLAESFSWMIVAKRDKREALVIMPERLFDAINETWGCFAKVPRLMIRMKTTIHFESKKHRPHVLRIMLVSDFFKRVRPQHIVDALREWKRCQSST